MTITWHAIKYKVDKLHKCYIISCERDDWTNLLVAEPNASNGMSATRFETAFYMAGHISDEME